MITECHGFILALQNTESGWSVREPTVFKSFREQMHQFWRKIFNRFRFHKLLVHEQSKLFQKD